MASSTSVYDVIIIGGGFVGLATAYHLAQRQAKVLLLEADSLGAGTSGACAGRAQVSESHRGLHMEWVLAGLARLENLEEELDFDFEWRRLGNLMLIEQEKHWRYWQEQVQYLQGRGVPAAMLNPRELQAREPLLDVSAFLGAAWCLEGHLNPFKYVQAWALAAQRLGAELRFRMLVRALPHEDKRVTAVVTEKETLYADKILVAAGAWSGKLLALAGADLPVRFTHAEAMITETLPPLLHHHIGLADFYDAIHNKARAVSIGVAQQQSGTLLITEAVEMTPTIHRRNSAWGIPAMTYDFLRLFPGLTTVRIRRAWAAPSPFLPDENPAIGLMPGFDNLFVATCLHLTITTIPVLAEALAQLLLAETPAIDLTSLSPARFQKPKP